MKSDGKNDDGKLKWHLLPMREVEQIAKVITFGHTKYGSNTWQKVPDGRDRCFSAMMRHISSWAQGAQLDSESGIHHLAHAACNCLFLMWFDRDKL